MFKINLRNTIETMINNSQTQREKGDYFEKLIILYLKNEPKYREIFSDVLTYKQFAIQNNLNAQDTGIDLIAINKVDNQLTAIQCKFYDEDYTISKSDIDSFFTASGKKIFSNRIIVTTTNNFSKNAEEALLNQAIPVQKIDLNELENSVIEWESYFKLQELKHKPKKSLMQHQEIALKDVLDGFKTNNRGKLIMACGTGKTFTSLKIAEKIAGKNKNILFLAPSLSLISQSLTEWTQQSDVQLNCYAVCSDSDVGKKKAQEDDFYQTNIIHELQYPATTDAKNLAKNFHLRKNFEAMNVVFSTYHSINVLSKAQKEFNFPEFDLIICDEAHRTTGATFEGEDESHFVKVHSNDFIKSQKRLYMTATPKIYGDRAKAKSIEENIELASMNDKEKFGEVFYAISFSEAVRLKLLVDYKVIVLSVDESFISERLGDLLKDENNQLKVDDAAKIVGCWKALSKQGSIEEQSENYNAMKKAVAFAQIIEPTKQTKAKKTASKEIAKMFERVVEKFKEAEFEYLTEDEKKLPSRQLICKADHIDGMMNATEKQEKLNWLNENNNESVCKILSNVRCLSEGVDVPSLDAVIFLTPKNSQIDVVQSVGRVMRNSPNKKLGYVILPVVIPSHLKPHEALNDNKIYQVVWQVLNALRAHDDSFDSMINKSNLIGLDKGKIEIIEITAKVEKISKKNKGENANRNLGKAHSIGVKTPKIDEPDPQGNLFKIEVGELEKALTAKMVEKCGNRFYWKIWANDVAEIANRHINRIKQILNNPNNSNEIKAFNEFLDEIHDDLNDSITQDEAIEMLAQHLITKPVFEALFADYEFAKNNPVSKAMEKINDELNKHHLEKESKHLESFYESIKNRVKDLEKNDVARQKIIIELYDKFFKNAFPKMTEKLGIVYTPVEVVDFIINSVADVLKAEFNQELGDKNVHILDPFTGTGTFITRLLQSGLIAKEKLPYKFQNEIHANEIVLLAYYIASINIESVFHQITQENYQAFNGICLTDTFSLFTKEDLVSKVLVDNSQRRKRQKELDIRIIIGNPPYSAGQKSIKDNNKNVSYPKLDERIAETYGKFSKTQNPNKLYDSYIRSFRFASDRIKDAGVIGFVSNGMFIDSNSADGLRKCLKDEFSKIYIFNLRGNARTSGEERRKEKGNVFGEGTRTPIAISILIKNPKSKEQGKIYYYDIGDYLNREQKLEKIANLKSVLGIKINWQEIVPDAHNDWINQRDNSFDEFIKIGDKKDKTSPVIFKNYSQGIQSIKDDICFNFSKKQLINNISNGKYFIKNSDIVISLYRPFNKSYFVYSKILNHRQGQMPQIFPNFEIENKVICITGIGIKDQFSTLITNKIPEYHFEKNGQCFPLYLYQKTSDKIADKNAPELFAKNQISSHNDQEFVKSDAITDEALEIFTKQYQSQENFQKFTKEDLFYYIYALLHSKQYREKYGDNLSKELPRIPAVKNFADFISFVQSGRRLADIHLNYETQEKFPLKIEYLGKEINSLNQIPSQDLRVEKMKFPKIDKQNDKSTIIYNHKITLKNIVLKAYEYEVNGKSAIEWVMDRQGVSINSDSQIKNDANDYAIDSKNNPAYIIELLQSVIAMSLQTIEIVNKLPNIIPQK